MQARDGAHSGSDRNSWDLDELAGAPRLADWMFEQFADAASGKVIEVGAGIGTFSSRLLDAGVDELLLIEPDPACAATLRRRFARNRTVRIAAESVPSSPQLDGAVGSADFVLCQNVLEHIEDDESALAAMAAALRPGGRLALLVPAHPRLFGSLDVAYGHHRRYTREVLARLAEAAGLEVRDLYTFNALGIAGWWVKSKRGATRLGAGSLAAYEALVRFWRPIERWVRVPWGLSLILHAERPDGGGSKRHRWPI
jgi:SAM-dependent methyltransferase